MSEMDKMKRVITFLLIAAMVFTMSGMSGLVKAEEAGYDVTKPVLEELIFEEQGQIVSNDAKLHVKVKAYDAETKTENLIIKMRFGTKFQNQNSSYGFYETENFVYNNETKCFEGSYSLADALNVGDIVYIEQITISDGKNVLTESYCSWTSEGASYLYSCNVSETRGGDDGSCDCSVSVTSFEFDKTEYKTGDTLTVKARLSKEVEAASMSLSMYNSADKNGAYTGAYQEIQLKNSENNPGILTGTIQIDDSMPSGSWDSYISSVGFKCEEHNNWKNITIPPLQDKITITTADDSVFALEKDGKKLEPGTVLKSGDSITISAALGKKEITDASVTLVSSVTDIEKNRQTIHLTKNEKNGTYDGTFTVDDNTYPCEWYFQEMYIYYENEGARYYYLNHASDNYFYVQQGNTSVIPTGNVNISFCVLDENGYQKWITKEYQNVKNHTTVAELLGTDLPSGETSFQGLQFEGWKNAQGADVNFDIIPVVVSNYTSFYGYYADYDKDILRLSCNYVNENGQLVYKYQCIPVEKDADLEDIKKSYCKDYENDYEGAKFVGWDDTDNKGNFGYSCNRTAKYDRAIVYVSGTYCGKTPDYILTALKYPKTYFHKTIVVDAEGTYGDFLSKDVKEYLDSLDIQHNKELTFEDWKNEIYSASLSKTEEDSLQKGYSQITLVPVYDKSIISLYLKDTSTTNGYYKLVQQTLGDKGSVYTIPTTLTDYKDLEWESYSEDGIYHSVTDEIDSIELSGAELTLLGSGIYNKITPPENPIDPIPPLPAEPTPEEPVIPEITPTVSDTVETPQKNTETVSEVNTTTTVVTENNTQRATAENTTTREEVVTETPQVATLPAEQIESVVSNITETAKGEKVVIEMGEATVIDKTILKAAKEKGVDLVLQMDGYSWSIDAKSIKASELESINLEVDLNANAVPSKVVQKLAGDNPTKQISLTHEGNFGFAATLSFNLGKEYKDQYGNLYWYDSDGKMVFIDSGLIDENGDVKLRFSHASDYVIVMKETSDLEEQKATDEVKEESIVAEADTTNNSSPMVLWIALGVVVVAVAGVVIATKKKKE